jgi:hypothetical protein
MPGTPPPVPSPDPVLPAQLVAFAAAVEHAGAGGGIAAGDVDGDGVLDLVANNGNGTGTNLGLLRGRGDGTFEPVRAVPAPPPAPGIRAVRDLNADLRADLLVGNSPALELHALLSLGRRCVSSIDGPVAATRRSLRRRCCSFPPPRPPGGPSRDGRLSAASPHCCGGSFLWT